MTFTESQRKMQAFIDLHQPHVADLLCHVHREPDGSVQTTIACVCGGRLRSEFPDGLRLEQNERGEIIRLHRLLPQ